MPDFAELPDLTALAQGRPECAIDKNTPFRGVHTPYSYQLALGLGAPTAAHALEELRAVLRDRPWQWDPLVGFLDSYHPSLADFETDQPLERADGRWMQQQVWPLNKGGALLAQLNFLEQDLVRRLANEHPVIAQGIEVIYFNEGPLAPSPTPFDNGVVDTADFIPFGEPGHPMAPKSVISIFGAGFINAGEFRADSIPLPIKLGGVQVTFHGIPAPLFLVTPGLIICQLPMGATLPTATMVITNGVGKVASEPQEVQVVETSPGIFALTQDGQGQAIVVFPGTVDLAAPAGTAGNSRPAREGDFLTIWCNGLGAVDPPIHDGRNSCDPDGVCTATNVVLHNTVTKPIIRIGGVQVPEANLLFSGASVASVAINETVFEMPPLAPSKPQFHAARACANSTASRILSELSASKPTRPLAVSKWMRPAVHQSPAPAVS